MIAITTLILIVTLAQKVDDAEAIRRTIAVESSAIDRSPDDTDALYRLGLAYLTLGDAKKAVKTLESLLVHDAGSVDGILLLAKAYRLSGDAGSAAALLDRSIDGMPDVVSLHAERGTLARSQDDATTAIKHYQAAVELSPNDVQLLFNLGEALQSRRSKLDEAIATYRKALALRADFTPAQVNLGKALADKGFLTEAKDILSSAARASLSDPDAQYNLGVLLMREGNLSAAITQFYRTLAINPKHAQALNNLGIAWDSRAEHKRALELFRKAAEVDPTSAEAFFNQGMSYIKLNQPSAATRAFEKALKLEPGASGPYVQLGTLYFEQGHKDRAVEAFKKAVAALDDEERKTEGFLALKKNFRIRRTTDAYRGLALALLSLGKADEAVTALRTAVSKVPKDPSARAALGDALVAQGKFDEAIVELKERLSLEPTTEARIDLANAYARKRNAKQALVLYQEVLQTVPDNVTAQMGLIDLYMSMGRYADAESLLKAALSRDANSVGALSRFGILKSRLGRPNEAMEPLAKVVAQNPLMLDARAEYAFLLFRGDPTQTDRCIKTLTDVLASDARHALSLHYRGMCLYAKGDKRHAEESFKAALSVDADLAAAHFSLGELYEAAGDRSQAAKEFGAAAALDHLEAREALKRLGAEAPGK